mgnify:FL=1
MTGREYLNNLMNMKTDKEKMERIASAFSADLPEMIIKLISNAGEPVFLDDGSRILSYDEIVDAEKDLHVAFKKMGILPLVDCGENDFIVYHFVDKSFSKFNIVDETVFKRGSSFEEILK